MKKISLLVLLGFILSCKKKEEIKPQTSFRQETTVTECNKKGFRDTTFYMQSCDKMAQNCKTIIVDHYIIEETCDSVTITFTDKEKRTLEIPTTQNNHTWIKNAPDNDVHYFWAVKDPANGQVIYHTARANIYSKVY